MTILNPKKENGYYSGYDEQGTFEASGHVVSVDKTTNGKLRIYDPQVGEIHIGLDAKKYIEATTTKRGISIPDAEYLRIDNKAFNPFYANNIFVRRK